MGWAEVILLRALSSKLVVVMLLRVHDAKMESHRVPIAFDFLTPKEVCAAFAHALQRPCRYVEGPITIEVPVPEGYEEQLAALQHNLGSKSVNGLEAPYWWPELFEIKRASKEETDEEAMERVARDLWPGWRNIEEYAGEPFVIEERLNGRTWMDGEDNFTDSVEGDVPSTPRDEIGELELEEARPL